MEDASLQLGPVRYPTSARSVRVVCAPEPFGARTGPEIFLAGPTPRSAGVASWRPEAVETLARQGFAGAVFVPEDRSGVFHGDYDGQVDWEWEGLERADAIAFWVPRTLPTMPGFTTNTEFGLYVTGGRCVLGFPGDAEKMRYLERLAGKFKAPVTSTLEETMWVAAAVAAADR